MEELMERKQPDPEKTKLFKDMAVRMQAHIPDATGSGESSAYLNLFKYWNDFLIKGKLPSYRWIYSNIFEASDLGGASVFMGCNEFPIFQFYSKEFIKTLAESIKKLDGKTIIEIGAGDGLLSYFLQQEGINITPTDDHSRNDIKHPERVKKLSHKEALEKYNPEVVVISWEELNYDYSVEVLNHPSVKYLVWIGERGGCTGSDKMWNYENEYLENPYCLARTDNGAFGGHMMRHTGVYLLLPKKNKSTEE
jgi:hypothetical protein